MVYRTRPGIVLLNICDSHVLAATRAAWDDCPHLRPIPTLWSICWALMEQGKTSEEALRFQIEFFHLPEDKLRAKLAPMFEILSREGFLIPEEIAP